MQATQATAATQATPAGACRIGAAARQSGVPAASIRHYESLGLLAPGPRGANGYRSYGAEDVHRLRFIRLCRALDMSLDEVRSLLALDLASKQDCAAARATLAAHLQHVRERRAELQVLEADLLALRDRCDGSARRCQLIAALHERADAPQPVKSAQPGMGQRHV